MGLVEGIFLNTHIVSATMGLLSSRHFVWIFFSYMKRTDSTMETSKIIHLSDWMVNGTASDLSLPSLVSGQIL